MKAATTSRFHSEMSAASRQRSARRRSMSSSRRSMREGVLDMAMRVGKGSDGLGWRRWVAGMGDVRFGPSGLPPGSFAEAAAALAADGYRACEIGFAGGFWLDYDTAPELGAALQAADVVL